MSRFIIPVILVATCVGCTSTEMAIGMFATGEFAEGVRRSAICKTGMELINQRALEEARIKNVAILVAPLHIYSYDRDFAKAPQLTFDIQQNLQSDVGYWFDLTDIDSTAVHAEWVKKDVNKNGYCPLNYEIRHETVKVDAVLEIEPFWLGFGPPTNNENRNETGIGPDVILVYQLKSSSSRKVLVRSSVFFSTFKQNLTIPGIKVVGPSTLRFDDALSASSQPDEMMRSIRFALKAAAKEIVLVVSENNRNVQSTAVEVASRNSDSPFYESVADK